MTEQPNSGMSLFDLLAREWALKEGISQVIFNHEDTGAAFRLLSGKLALASLKDTESPKIRTRLDLETGRTTIRPRENPITPLRTADINVHENLPVVRFGAQGFAAIDSDGVLNQITAGGQVVVKLRSDGKKITALCSDKTGQTIAIARANEVTFYSASDMSVIAEITLPHPVYRQAMSDNRETLAVWGDATLSLIAVGSNTAPTEVFDCPGEITEITWDSTGQHLACGAADNSFFIINRASKTVQRVADYPSPVRNTAFSKKAKALVTSGAFRLVGWDIADLPQNDAPGTPLATGKPGFVVINAIAAHPKLDLVATGYANGLVAIAKVGTSQDMMLHHEPNTEVSAVSWSKTGEHLAIAFSSGKAAIITFPTQMFK